MRSYRNRYFINDSHSGIGRQLCITLNANGAKVVATGRDRHLLQSLRDEVKCDCFTVLLSYIFPVE